MKTESPEWDKLPLKEREDRIRRVSDGVEEVSRLSKRYWITACVLFAVVLVLWAILGN